MQPQLTATVVTQAPGSKLYKMVRNVRSKNSNGVLSLCWLEQSRTYFISIGEFCTNLYPNTPFVSIDTQKGVTFVFPDMNEGVNAIFVPGEPARFFKQNISQVIQVISYENAISIPMFKVTIETHCKDIITNPIENQSDAIDYIQQGGEAAKKGFSWLGGKLSEGINKGGQFINSKIDKQENVEVSMETKVKYEVAKQTASQTVTVAGNILSQLFKPVAEKAKELQKDMNKKIDESDNQSLKDGRQVAIATWDSLGVAVTGLSSALSQVGDSIGTNTKQCVEKRYGQDVSNTFIGQNQPFGNINIIQAQQDLSQYQKIQ